MPPPKRKVSPRVVEVDHPDLSSDSEPEALKPGRNTSFRYVAAPSVNDKESMKGPTLIVPQDDESKLSQKDIASLLGIFSKNGITFNGEITDQKITRITFQTADYPAVAGLSADCIGEMWQTSWEEPHVPSHRAYNGPYDHTRGAYGYPRVKYRTSSSRRSSSGKTHSVRPKNKGLLEFLAT